MAPPGFIPVRYSSYKCFQETVVLKHGALFRYKNEKMHTGL
jgi:hypothetical protein